MNAAGPAAARRRLLHFVSLGQPGGVERHLVEFVRHAARIDSTWQHAVLAAGAPVHPYLTAGLDGCPLAHEKYLGRIKLPSRPAALRRYTVRRTFRRTEPETVLVWNRTVRSRSLFDAVAPASWLYWEHGSAWGSECERRQRAFYARCPWIVANSRSAARILALRWDRRERVEICTNALRPSLLPDSAVTGKPQPARPVRLGMAGRVVAIKGGALTIHALALLHRRGIAAELHVAGHGDREAGLKSLAARLGISDSIFWHGLVRDMGAFYRRVDCLVHPALHESFGLACLEAAAHGCPVVAANVDGLPEVVRDGATGLCIAPELPLSDYPALGGSLEDMPSYVYDPASDELTAPRLVSPQALADAIERVLDPETFSRFSAAAAAAAREQYGFRPHVEAVMRVVERCNE